MTTIRLELGNFGFAAGNRKGKTFAGLLLVWLLIADGIVHLLPERARPGFRRAVHRIDQIYLQRTHPDPVFWLEAPWRERRY